MSKLWPRWPLLLASFLTAGPVLAAGEKLAPVSRNALDQLRARESARVATSLSSLRTLKSALGLNERDDFRLTGAQTDAFGLTHAHFQQLHQGVPVWGSMAITHLDPSGKSLPVTRESVRPGVRLSTSPKLDMASAMSLAQVELTPNGLMGAEPTAELVIYPETRRVNGEPGKELSKLNAVDFTEEVVGYRLAWHVHTELDNPKDGVAHTDFLLDANTGVVLKRWNSLQTEAAVGRGLSQYSGEVRLDTFKNAAGLYELRDTTRTAGEGLRTYDVNHAEVQNGAPAVLGLYTDTDNVWGDGQNYIAGGSTTNANGQTAAVDAHFGLQATWDYYQKIHGRFGIDGMGTPTYNRVHVGNLYNNAFWSNACFCMSYGDGSFPAAGGFKSLEALDVTGHELSHGVMSQTAQLIYAGESGGLNESNSDIFGAMTEFWVRNGRGATIGNTGGNWLIGEDLNVKPLRVMYKPSLDGISPDAWSASLEAVDVHYSSGPMNRAFYFLSAGAQSTATTNDYSSPFLPGGMTGIGNDKAAAIWYRAITVYLVPSSNYVAARTASLQSAADLFGAKSAEYTAVVNAFSAINVGYTASGYDDRTAPSVSASVSGSAPFLQLNAVASDNVGVARVEFLVDGALVATDVSLPFQTTLDVTPLNNGTHKLVARAFDTAGNKTDSAPVTFNVANSFTQLLSDPGFEQGGVGWEANPRGNINFPVSGARSGQGYVWLNGYGTVSDDNLYQDVTIPAGATKASLTFYLNITTAETSTTAANDTLTLQARDTSNTVLATLATWSNLNPTLGWVQRSVDLTAYAGQTVRIYLRGQENNSLPTNFKLDDFQLRVITATDTEAPLVKGSVAMNASGSVVGLLADVSDNGFVGAVEFLVDGTSVGSAPTSFARLVTAASLGNGTHSLVVRATDAAGNVGQSAPVPFFVDASRSQVVINPSFELSTGWTSTTTLSGSAGILTSASFAHTGSRFFIVYTNVGPNQSTVRQTITIPATAQSAIYSFWMRIYDGAFMDGKVHHTYTAKVRSSAGVDLQTLKTFTNLDQTGVQYFEHRFDLSAYKGQTLQLFFDANLLEPALVPGGVTQWFLDDVTLYTTTTPDTQPPALTASVNGTYGTVKLNASVSDNVWTQKLEFLVDDVLVDTKTNPSGSYTVPYNTASLSNGTHRLTVKGTDTAGNVSTVLVDFDTFNSTVVDNAAPTVSANVEGVYESTVFTASASDDTGVTHVEFYVDGVFQGRVQQAPYRLPFSTLPLSPGEHSLMAVAYDAYGHSTSATKTFRREGVAITPSQVVMAVNSTFAFSSDAPSGMEATLQWSVKEGRVCGTVSGTGVYTSPSSRGVCHVQVALKSDARASSTATARIYSADLNGDGRVDGEDLGRLAQAHGSTPGGVNYSEDADFDASGAVNDADITLFVSQFGR